MTNYSKRYFTLKDIQQFCALIDSHRRSDRQYVGRMFFVAFYEHMTGKPSEFSPWTDDAPEVPLDKWENSARVLTKDKVKDYPAFEELASLITSPEVAVSDRVEDASPLFTDPPEDMTDW